MKAVFYSSGQEFGERSNMGVGVANGQPAKRNEWNGRERYATFGGLKAGFYGVWLKRMSKAIN